MTILFLAHLLVLIALGFILRKNASASLRVFFWPAYMVKLSAGVGIGLLYSLYYSTGDTYNYFQDGLTLADLAQQDIAAYLRFIACTDTEAPVWQQLVFQDPRALFLSKVVSVFALFTGRNYWIIGGYFSLCSFSAAWYLVEVVCRHTTRHTLAALLAFLFFPSVMFWSAGIVKESLAMAALYVLCAAFLQYWRRMPIPWGVWFAVPLCMWFLWMLKYYYFAAFFPVVFTAVAVRFLWSWFRWRSRLIMPLVWLAVFVLPLSLAASIHPNFYPERFLEVVVSNYEVYTALSDPQDRIDYPGFNATVGSVVGHMPKALLSALFRPLPWEAHRLFQYVISVENCILLVLCGLCLWHFRKGAGMTNDDLILVVSILVYVVVLAVFLALSTPNFGTLSRYRVGFVPFLVFLLTCGNNHLERLQLRFLNRSA